MHELHQFLGLCLMVLCWVGWAGDWDARLELTPVSINCLIVWNVDKLKYLMFEVGVFNQSCCNSSHSLTRLVASASCPNMCETLIRTCVIQLQLCSFERMLIRLMSMWPP